MREAKLRRFPHSREGNKWNQELFCRLWKQHPKPGFPYGHPKGTDDRRTQWSFHRKGRKVERNAYLDGIKKFTVSWVLTKNFWRKIHEDTPICTLPAVFIVKYIGKLIGEDIQLVIDSCLLHFHLQEGQGQKRTGNTNIRHLLVLISSKFYY